MTDGARMALCLLLCSLALALAEMQSRREATQRWLCLALVWFTAAAMLFYVYSGA